MSDPTRASAPLTRAEGDSLEFDPDWCIAPSETLRTFINKMVPMPRFEMSLDVLAVTWGGRDNEHHAYARERLQEVMDRVPLTEEHVAVLARCTGGDDALWRNLEQNYRAALSAGKKDISDGID